jgi:hypothetical protein
MNKRGVELLVTYVILIVIAVALSVIIYSYLKTLTPLDPAECKQDIHLVVFNYTCTDSTVKLRLQNKGLFNVSAAYIRLGKEGREVRSQINKNQEYFPKGPLGPQQVMANPLLLPTGNIIIEDGYYILEIQPAVYVDRQFVACENAVITERIYCTAS